MNESTTEVDNMTLVERLSIVDKIIVQYPKMERIHKKMDECIISPQYSDLPECMSILGPSRAGKTTILKKFMEKYPDIEDEEGIRKQILYCEVPCPPAIGNLPTALLYALGDPFYNKGRNTAERTLRLERLIQDCNIKMIILDEVQHLVEGTTPKLQRQASDWFKNIINKTRVPMIFSGLDSGSIIFEINSQLKSRVLNNYRIAPFRITDKEFKGIVHVIDQNLPLAESSNLIASGLCDEIFSATEGHLGYLKELLKESVKIAVENDYKSVTRAVLSKAYQNKLARVVNGNPFV